MKTLLILITSLFNILFANAQPDSLQRRVYIGIKMDNLTDDARKVMELGDLKGILISEVLPKSTAESAGFKKGDVLISLDGTGVSSTQDVFSLLSGKSAGNAFSFELYRNKKTIKGKSVFKTFPEEHYPDIDVVYSSSKSAVGLERIIITRPRTAVRMPVIAFIGGIGCYSLDSPLDTNLNEIQMLNALTRAGYLCARLEKPGMGDNVRYCKPCNEVSFNDEADGYVQAINTLKKRDDVDSNAIYIFGHSMGGVFAPLVAKQTAVKGIIAYGTIGSNFIEYLNKTRRTIAEAYAMTPEETDDYIKESCECSGYYFVDKLTTAEAAKKNPECKDIFSVFDLRSRAYNDELYAFNIPSLWKSFSGRALLMWGECDFISSREDHQIVTDAVNYYHKGNAEFATVKRATHGMETANSFAEAKNNPGPFNREVSKTVLAWLTKQP